MARPVGSPPPDPAASEPTVTDPAARPPRWRSTLLGVAVGAGVAVAAVAMAFSVVAIPLFVVASTEPGSGLNRDLVRTGLFKVALPFGLLTGMACGVAVGVWYGRGGRLPRDRTPIDF